MKTLEIRSKKAFLALNRLVKQTLRVFEDDQYISLDGVLIFKKIEIHSDRILQQIAPTVEAIMSLPRKVVKTTSVDNYFVDPQICKNLQKISPLIKLEFTEPLNNVPLFIWNNSIIVAPCISTRDFTTQDGM